MNLPVHTARHTAQCRHGLTLRSSRDQYGLLIRIALQLIDADEGTLWDIDIVKLGRYGDDIHHGTTLHHDLPLILRGGIDDLLYTIDVRRKGRHDDTVLLVLGKDTLEGTPDGALRHRRSRLLRIRRIRHHRQDAFLTELSEALQIDRITEDRCIVDLEVAGVNDGTGRCEDRERGCILDGVIRLDELHLDIAEVDDITEGLYVQLHQAVESALTQLSLDECKRQPCSIHRHIDLLQNIWQRTDVVLMSVGDDEALDLRHVALQIGDVRDDQVDPQHIVGWKSQTAVHDDDAVITLKRGNVHADLIESAERNDLNTAVLLHLYFI